MSVNGIGVIARTHEIKVHSVDAPAVAHMHFTNLGLVLKILTLRIQFVSPGSSKKLKHIAPTQPRRRLFALRDFPYIATVAIAQPIYVDSLYIA
jgi:hypothetical protein